MQNICRGLLMWAALKCNLVARRDTEQNMCAERGNACWTVGLGASSILEKCSQHLSRAVGCPETRGILRYHQEVQNQETYHLRRWNKWERWKKGKTSWENKVQQPLAVITARTGNSGLRCEKSSSSSTGSPSWKPEINSTSWLLKWVCWIPSNVSGP